MKIYFNDGSNEIAIVEKSDGGKFKVTFTHAGELVVTRYMLKELLKGYDFIAEAK